LLGLRPLSALATAELVRSRFTEEAADELCDACYRATGGNPFLVHQLADALLAEGVVPDADAGASVSRLVPRAVARHVLVRLSRLGPETIGVAHALAVLGPGAELRHVAALADVGETDTAIALDALVSADILAPDRPVDFKHPLLAEAVYADARPGERMLAHARAARMLAETGSPPERVALQLLLCEPDGSEWAVATLQAAAKEASSRGAPQTAVRYLERALEEAPPRSDQRGLLLELGIAESRAAQPRAGDHLAEALRCTDDPIERARIAQELAALHNLLGQFDQATVVLEEAIEPLGAGDDELRFSLEAEIAVLAVTTLSAKERLASRMAGLREKAASVVNVPAAAPLLAVIALDLAETDAPAERAIECARQAFADRRLLSREGAVPAIGTAALVIADQPAEADAILTAAIAAAQLRGSIQATRIALVNRAYARNRQGRIAEAEADARLALELSDAEAPDPVRPFKVAQLSEALIERGELGEVDALLSAAELGRNDPGEKLVQPLADARGRFLLAKGRAREACVLLDDQLRRQHAWGLRNPGWTSTRSLAACAHLAVDDVEEARALAAEDLLAASAFGAARPLGIALRTTALVGPGAGIEDLRGSAAVLEVSEARLELAKTLVELGSALRRTGSRSAAREPLQRALELADACGGAVVAERARTELLATGARPRRPTDGELTPSERRVAAMARDGLSNREIARGLYVSPKTVEMHLSHAYSKLGIRSRTQLAGALEPAEVQGAGTGSSL
jgi:DNA-binding CsgD family transcriptional regulator